MRREARRVADAKTDSNRRSWNSRFPGRSQNGWPTGISDDPVARLTKKGTVKRALSAAQNSNTYHRLSHLYDRVFTPFLESRIHRTISSLEIPPGARVLDVGIGTGSSLEAYPLHCEITGIDLSEEMLQHAREKVERHGWRHISLQQMDALSLDFPDHAFDYVMAFHVAAVVPDCRRLMREVARVCKPGGTIAIINHLRSEGRITGPLLDILDPVTHLLGWQTRLRYEDLVGAAPIRVVRRFKTSAKSLFTVIIAEHSGVRAGHPSASQLMHARGDGRG